MTPVVNFINVFSSYVWLGAKNLYEKRAQKTLMKLTTGVNLINIQ